MVHYRKPALGCIPKLLEDDDEELSSIPILVEGEEVDLKLVDSAEGGELDRLRLAKYETAHVIALCFSVTNPSSLQSVTTKWLPEIRYASLFFFFLSRLSSPFLIFQSFVLNRATAPHVPILLVGTKSDLRKKEEETLETYKYVGQQSVPEDQAKQIAKMLKASFIECSAFTGINIKNVFDELIKLSLMKRKNKKRKGGKRCAVM